jgi:hypothetical protein
MAVSVCGNLCSKGHKQPLITVEQDQWLYACSLPNQGPISSHHWAWLLCLVWLCLYATSCAGKGANSHSAPFPWNIIGWEPSPTFYFLPLYSWTFLSNSMTSFQPHFAPELSHKTQMQGNDWLETPPPFLLLSTIFQDFPIYI